MRLSGSRLKPETKGSEPKSAGTAHPPRAVTRPKSKRTVTVRRQGLRTDSIQMPGISALGDGSNAFVCKFDLAPKPPHRDLDTRSQVSLEAHAGALQLRQGLRKCSEELPDQSGQMRVLCSRRLLTAAPWSLKGNFRKQSKQSFGTVLARLLNGRLWPILVYRTATYLYSAANGKKLLRVVRRLPRGRRLTTLNNSSH